MARHLRYALTLTVLIALSLGNFTLPAAASWYDGPYLNMQTATLAQWQRLPKTRKAANASNIVLRMVMIEAWKKSDLNVDSIALNSGVGSKLYKRSLELARQLDRLSTSGELSPSCPLLMAGMAAAADLGCYQK